MLVEQLERCECTRCLRVLLILSDPIFFFFPSISWAEFSSVNWRSVLARKHLDFMGELDNSFQHPLY